MDEVYRAEPLSAEEWACLRHLVSHPDVAADRYSNELLDGLVARGLVDKFRSLALPVVPQQYRYRLTHKGRALLAAASH